MLPDCRRDSPIGQVPCFVLSHQVPEEVAEGGAVFPPLLLAASTTHPQGWGSDQNLGDCALKHRRQMTIAGWIPHQPGRSGVPGRGPWA